MRRSKLFVSFRLFNANGLRNFSSYSCVSEQDISFFSSIDASMVLTSDLEPFTKDWLGFDSGKCKLVLRPKSTEEVALILRHANERRLAVVPQGGNTGLVGGSVPVQDEIVLSLSRMNKIQELDENNSSVSVESGVVLQVLEEYLRSNRLVPPVDLGSKGSAQIGGLVSTNAGGVHFLRYGSLFGNVLGLTAVLADGSVVRSNMKGIRKNNTGFGKEIFIGSEGQLGVVTEVSLLCYPDFPKMTGWIACSSFAKVIDLLHRARTVLGESLHAFEVMDRQIVDVCGKNPLESFAPFFVLVEVAGASEAHNEEKMMALLETVEDGLLAQSEQQRMDLWHLRELPGPAFLKLGRCFFYDLSLPLEKYYEPVELIRERLPPECYVVGFGHVGDGNLHLNVCAPPEIDGDKVKQLIEPYLWEYVSKQGGSISAEHGVGTQKRGLLKKYARTEQELSLMKILKKSLDPNRILNPLKTLEMD